MRISKSDSAYSHDTVQMDISGEDWAFVETVLYTSEYATLTLSDEAFFMLSAEEVAKYRAQGTFPELNGQAYWLRSPGINDSVLSWMPKTAGLVGADTALSLGNVNIVQMNNTEGRYNIGARPAFNLDTNKVLFFTAADNSWTTGFSTVSKENIHDFKAVLADGNNFASKASLGEYFALSGTDLTLTHRSLSSFGNDYNNVMAVLTDANGKVVCRGSINTDRNATSSRLTVPKDLQAGRYMLAVYGYADNGAYVSDIATGTAYTASIEVNSCDVDQNGALQIADVTALLDALSSGATTGCDMTGEGIVDISDVTELLDVLATQ